MRKSIVILLVAVTVGLAVPAFADLQNVQVGGSIAIRGNYWTQEAGSGGYGPLRWVSQPGRSAVNSLFGWDNNGNGNSYVEERTRLNVKADFTDNVSAFIELDSYDVWGNNFRSQNWTTGQDTRGVADVTLYQAYIEAKEMFGYPLQLRIGRQELSLGSGWLIGDNSRSLGYSATGLSFDGVRATYATDQFSVDAVWAKLAEKSPNEEDGDVDLYGVYGTYKGIENISLDAYWLMVRDARSVNDTPVLGGIEHWLGADDYDVTNLHTVGLRAAGTYNQIDFNVEGAYQFGNADAVGNTFAAAGLVSPYGDDNAKFNNWAANVEVGYTFDMTYSPRVFVGGAYLSGEDNRDLNFWQWVGAVACPFWHANSSVSFNRLFSNEQYSYFLDANGDLSNVWLARAGVSAMPMENLKVTLTGTYLQSLSDYSSTWPTYTLFGCRMAPLYPFSFFDQNNSDDLGWELAVKALYKYSADLSFEAGYAHFFVGKGLAEGNFNGSNGLSFNGGTDNNDPDYFYFATKLSF